MKVNVGRRDVACARKIGMKNNFCGPWYEVMLRPVAKPYFSSHERSLCHVPSNLIFHTTLWPTNLIFHTNFSSAYHVPSTHVHSHASILRPTNLIFHTKFSTSRRPRFTFMQAPFGLTNLIFHTKFSTSRRPCSLSCKHPLTHKPYFSYQFFDVPSTQVHSHASTLRPTNLIFHTIFPTSRRPRFILMQAPFDPQTLFLHTIFSSTCHVPSTLMQAPFGPQTLFLIPTFRAHATSRRPSFILMQAPFGLTNLIFHTNFSTSRRPRLTLIQAPFDPQTLFLIPFLCHLIR